MKITAVTSIKYQDEALEQQYRGRVDKFLQKLLDKVAAGEDAGNTLGMQVETWYPDQNTKVDVNIQPGVTTPIIRVRVMRVEENPTQKPKKKKKEGTGYIPYLWVGVAAYDHSFNDIAYREWNTDNTAWGSPIGGRLYGIEPLQPGETYALHNGVESQRGACYPFDHNITAFCENAPYDLGPEASRGACEKDQWLILASSCDYELTEGINNYGGTSVVGWDCDTLDFDYSGPEFLADFSLNRCGNNSHSYTHSAFRSVNNMYLLGTVGTQLYGPESAWADELPQSYWQQSILVDPDGSDVRESMKNATQVHWEWGGGWGITFTDTEIIGPTLKSTLLPGKYRIDVAAAGMECEGWDAKVRIRIVLGKSGVVPSKDPERIGELDIAIEEVVDIYCDGIGSDNDQTVINEWYGRLWAMSGAHVYDYPQNETEKYPEAYGPNPGAPENPGFWSQSLYVDVENGSWEVVPFQKLYPFWGNDPNYGNGMAATFNSCECAVEEGTGCFNDPNPVTSGTFLLYEMVTCGNYTNINGGYGFQLAEVVYRCDDYLIVKMRGNLGQCPGGVPCFAEGGCEMAQQVFASEDLWTQRVAGLGETDLRVGELVMVVAINFHKPKLGVARVIPQWLTRWWWDLRCPNTQWWQTFVRHTQERGRARVKLNEAGTCVPDPIYFKYNIAGRGFDW